MKPLFIAVIIVVGLVIPYSRCILFHPFKSVYYVFIDLYKRIKHKEGNKCSTGKIIAYCGLFGRGKTLSAVHDVVFRYRKYNNLKVWCPERKKFVTQKIKIISNVELVGIPYEKLISLQQIIDQANNRQKWDEKHDTLTITLVLGDEFSVQLNSRNFKKNIDPLFLNTLLTCRHHYISLFYTAQRFNQVDALLRQVTSEVYDCQKVWRLVYHRVYDAWDMENCSNVQNLKSIGSDIWFCRDADFEVYDTLACVKNLSEDYKKGNMLSSEEILALQANQSSDVAEVAHPSLKLRKRLKKGGS